MTIITLNDTPTPMPPTIATIGVFDGVHLGHRSLIDDIRRRAAEHHLASLVVTFDNHPARVLKPECTPGMLSTVQEKMERIAATGVDYCALLHFDRTLAALSAHDFMSQVLRSQLNTQMLVTGYDNRFGHNRSETFADYVGYGRALGIEVIEGQPLILNGVAVSSSAVRKCLTQGDVEEAHRLLGYTYSVEAPVVGGFAEGRRMGFRTANLDLCTLQKMLPSRGVYATRVKIDGKGAWLPAMTNIGMRPTFGRTDTTVETFILDFDANLYDHRIEVAFCHRLRNEQQFAGEAELARQLQEDEAHTRKLLNI